MDPMPTVEPPARKLTYEDYCKIPEDRNRHEIVDGVHVVSPAPQLPHQRVLGRLFLDFGNFVERSEVGEVFFAPVDVLLGPHDIVQPDIVFISTTQEAIKTKKNVQGSPDLVVEVLSPSNRRHDVVRKRRRYEAHGVPEFWLIDPEVESVTVLRLNEEGCFEKVLDLSVVDGGGEVTSPQLPGFSVSLARLFR